MPDTNARNGYLPCKLVTPAPVTCPVSGVVFVGTSALITAWPVPSPGAPDFGGIAEDFNTPLLVIRDDLGTARHRSDLFGRRHALCGVYDRRQRRQYPHSTNLYSTDVETLREQVASLTERMCSLPGW